MNQHYRSDMPPEAEERVESERRVDRRGNVLLRRMVCLVDGEVVGYRTYFDTGELCRETPLRHDNQHGTEYVWSEPGHLALAEPYADGVVHGTAVQFDGRGHVIGTYTMEHGTGWYLWRQPYEGWVYLVRARRYDGGQDHGYDWCFYGLVQEPALQSEAHRHHGELHGIHRQWYPDGRLHRGCPTFYVHHDWVYTKREYLRFAAQDPTLPPFRPEDNLPQRDYPPEVAAALVPQPLPATPPDAASSPDP